MSRDGSGPYINPRHRRFAAEYLIDLNGSAAAQRVGYGKSRARITASWLLDKPEIQSLVAAGKQKQLEEAGLTAHRVLEEYRRVAFLDVRIFYDAEGNLKPVKEWTADMGACVASFETLIKNTKAGDGIQDTVHRVRLVDKTRALESLAKHFGLLVDRQEHSGEILLRHELDD